MNFLDASELECTYFATATMVAKKLSPHNLQGQQLGDYPYAYSKTKRTDHSISMDDMSLIQNVTIDYFIFLLKHNKQNKMLSFVTSTQGIRGLFSKKRQDQDIHNLLKSNLNADTYRTFFKSMVTETKNEYFLKIGFTIGIMCTIFFGARYAKGMYNPRIANILLWSSETLGTFFIVHQSYQWARLRTKYAELGLIND